MSSTSQSSSISSTSSTTASKPTWSPWPDFPLYDSSNELAILHRLLALMSVIATFVILLFALTVFLNWRRILCMDTDDDENDAHPVRPRVRSRRRRAAAGAVPAGASTAPGPLSPEQQLARWNTLQAQSRSSRASVASPPPVSPAAEGSQPVNGTIEAQTSQAMPSFADRLRHAFTFRRRGV